MKFDTTPTIDADFKALARKHQKAFLAVLPAFSAACDEHARTPRYTWPRSLRVARLKGTSEFWEMTWSFSGPDGRATFQFLRHGGEVIWRWRRVGDHQIYREP